jgi:hypothetical protein
MYPVYNVYFNRFIIHFYIPFVNSLIGKCFCLPLARYADNRVQVIFLPKCRIQILSNYCHFNFVHFPIHALTHNLFLHIWLEG